MNHYALRQFNVDTMRWWNRLDHITLLLVKKCSQNYSCDNANEQIALIWWRILVFLNEPYSSPNLFSFYFSWFFVNSLDLVKKMTPIRACCVVLLSSFLFGDQWTLSAGSDLLVTSKVFLEVSIGGKPQGMPVMHEFVTWSACLLIVLSTQN